MLAAQKNNLIINYLYLKLYNIKQRIYNCT